MKVKVKVGIGVGSRHSTPCSRSLLSNARSLLVGFKLDMLHFASLSESGRGEEERGEKEKGNRKETDGSRLLKIEDGAARCGGFVYIATRDIPDGPSCIPEADRKL